MKSKSLKVLLILAINPLTKYSINRRFYFKHKSKNFKIMYWNLLPLVDKNTYLSLDKKNNRILKNNKFIKIDSFSKLIKELKKLPKNFYYWYQLPTSFIWALLDRFIKIIGGKKIFVLEEQDILKNLKSLNSIKDMIYGDIVFFILRLFNYLIQKAKKIIILAVEPKPEIFFTANLRNFLYLKKKNNNNKIFKVDGVDLSIFYNMKSSRVRKNIIFLDQQLGDSWERAIVRDSLNKKETVIQAYWRELYSFFDLIDKKFPKDKILISSHPRRPKNINSSKYKFIFDRTPELVRDCKLVIAHDSLSLNFAVLFRKPIILLNMPVLKYFGVTRINRMKEFSKKLDCNLIDLNDNSENLVKRINTNKLLKVNNSKYKKFESYDIGFSKLKSQGFMLKKIANTLNNFK